MYNYFLFYHSTLQLDENNALRVWNSTISNQNKADAQAGEIIAIDKQGVHVACGENKADVFRIG